MPPEVLDCVWDGDASQQAPGLVEGEPYLVEIWQNYRGQKLVWQEVMVWSNGNWALYSDPCKKLAFNQIAYRWAKISDITQWARYKQSSDQQ